MSATGFYGEWIGAYLGHFEETVSIEQTGCLLIARKVTGDDYVPAGEITWRLDLHTMKGEGQIAEKEFVNPRFVPGRLEIINHGIIRFIWEGHCQVDFRRDGI